MSSSPAPPSLNCPACGAAVPRRLRHAKLTVCEHCRTALFLEDEAARSAGEKSVLAPAPSILQLGRRFRYRNWLFEPYGHLRYEYGDGFWDEWWVILDSGAGKWISIDEGDVAVENRLDHKGKVPALDALDVGARITAMNQTLTVTEKNRATCAGFEGELPEVVTLGEAHDYVHLSGPRGLLITLEWAAGSVSVYKGVWVDPFDIEPL